MITVYCPLRGGTKMTTQEGSQQDDGEQQEQVLELEPQEKVDTKSRSDVLWLELLVVRHPVFMPLS